MGVEGNDIVHILAKKTLGHPNIDIQVPISNNEIKTNIQKHMLEIIWPQIQVSLSSSSDLEKCITSLAHQ